jgi:hypothetical protein
MNLLYFSFAYFRPLRELIAIKEIISSLGAFKMPAGGQRFQCIITDPKKKKALDLRPARNSNNLKEYLCHLKTEITLM